MPRLNVGSIIGGRGESYILIEPPYIPDYCTILVDVHFVPGQTVDTIVQDIRRTIDPLAARDPQLRYEIEIPPPDYFKGRRRLVMAPLDVPKDEYIVQAVSRSHQEITGQPIRAIGAILPFSYSAGDATWLWQAGIPCLEYGPAGGFNDSIEGEDNFYVSISEMVTCARVLALTALDVCNLDSL
jgi:acetylornithine deacetylase